MTDNIKTLVEIIRDNGPDGKDLISIEGHPTKRYLEVMRAIYEVCYENDSFNFSKVNIILPSFVKRALRVFDFFFNNKADDYDVMFPINILRVLSYDPYDQLNIGTEKWYIKMLKSIMEEGIELTKDIDGFCSHIHTWINTEDDYDSLCDVLKTINNKIIRDLLINETVYHEKIEYWLEWAENTEFDC